MPSPPLLVSFETAAAWLRQTCAQDSAEASEIMDCLTMAEDIIQNASADEWDETWTVDTVPGDIKAEILKELANLWRHRGDEAREHIDEHSSLRRWPYVYARKGPTVA